MSIRERVGVVVLAALGFAGLAHGQANVDEGQETAAIYVDIVNGSDSNPGTQSQPLQHIAAAVALAETNNQQGIGTHVYINPGLYRENITLRGNGYDTNLPETFEAATSGTVFISGADQYTNWTQTSNPSVYSTPWTYNFGLCPPLLGQAPPETDINLRREMAFINGTPLTQVLSMSEMLEGTFYVDDAGGLFYIWPPSGTDVNSADIELADRYQLWAITNKNGVVIRGLTFEYSADCVADGAMEVDFGGSQNVLIDSDNFIWNNATGLHLFAPLTNYTVENTVANHNGAVGINAFETTSGLYQNDTADFNNWRGMEAAYYNWGAAGINIYGDIYDTESNVMTDWNAATGFHWDTNISTINASSMYARNNLYHGLQLERNTGPMTLDNMIVCNNANEALMANGVTSSAGGVSLRDSANVSLTNSFVYGNGNAELNIIGEPGGIPIIDWYHGTIVIVNNQNFVSTNNVFEATDTTQNAAQDSALGGPDWALFTSTLNSGNNTWWNANNSTAFTLPVPAIWTVTDFPGWQAATSQDLTSSFSEPTGNQQAQCAVPPDGPDLWAVINNAGTVLDPSGQATAVYTYIPIDGFDNGTLNITLAGLDAIPGVSGTITPTSLPDSAGQAVLSVSATTAAVPGTYQYTVLANAGSTTRMVEQFLTIPQTSLRFSPTMNPNFGSVQQGQQSDPQTFTITNIGSADVTNLVIGTAPPGFSYTTTCQATLPAGQSCSLSIVFSPNAGLGYSNPLTITDSDPTTPQIMTLVGTGISAAILNQSAYTLQYGTITYGLNSTQTVTFTNTGTVAATFSPAAFSGAGASSYSQTNNCEPSLAVGNSCTYTITFAPQALGQIQATLTIPDNTIDLTNAITLTGTGQTAVNVNPLALSFGNVAVTNTASRTTTITNSGNDLPVTFALSDNVNFSQTNTCGSTIPANSSCTVTVVFAPQTANTFTATLSVNDSDPTSPQSVSLSGTGTEAVTNISATPTSLTFGNVAWNFGSSKTINVQDNGNVAAFFTTFAFSGAGAASYSQTNTCGSTIPAHTSCTVTVTFTPQSLGSLPASLTINDNNTNGPNMITLTGSGISSLTMNPGRLTFGTVIVGGNSVKPVTLINAGSALPVAISLSDTTDYSESDNCAGVVPAQGSCVVNVTFAPQSAQALNGSLTITDADPASPQSVSLTGSGAYTNITTSPSTVTFGNVVWGLSSTKTSMVTNNSTTLSAIIGTFSMSGSPGYTQSNNCPASLAPLATCTITVTFAPASLGSLTGTLTFQDSTSSGYSTVSLTGTGITSATVSPATLAFGSVVVGNTSTKTATLTNAGNALPVAISLGDTTDYSESDNCGGNVPAQGSCTISVTFAPKSVATLNSTVTIMDADPSSPQAIALTGSGISSVTTVTTTPTSLSFSSVMWGFSATKTVTLKNTGKVNATFGAYTFTDATDYTQTNNCPASLAPKATCVVSVTFAPQAIGSRPGTLSIADNTLLGANVITLSGTGKTSITTSPRVLTFGSVKVGHQSAAKTVTFTNSGNAIALAVSLGGNNPGDWTYTTNCPATVPAHGSCTVSVTMAPQEAGLLSANVVFTDADPTGPQLVPMTGSSTN